MAALKLVFAVVVSAIELTSTLAHGSPYGFELFVPFTGRHVPFFSRKGAKAAAKWHVPKPPVRMLSLSKADPPRDVAAEKWRAQFCRKWNDGEQVCEHADGQVHVACTALVPPASRHPVVCDEATRDSGMSCGSVETKEVIHYSNGSEFTDYGGSKSQWFFDATKKAAKWKYSSVDGGGSLPVYPFGRLPQEDRPTLVSTSKEVVCKQAYDPKLKDGTGSVFINVPYRRNQAKPSL